MFLDEEAKLVASTKDTILIEDGKGAFAIIDYKTLDMSTPGLGFKHCLDGNQEHQYRDIMSKVQDICSAVSASHLTEREAM